MIDRLADPIIMELLNEVPQLAFVSHRFYALAELLARNRLLTYFDFQREEIDGLAEDMRNHMQFESWRTAEDLAKSDYWIFDQKHVVDTKGGVYPVLGEPYGLQLNNWHIKTLQYDARLRCGVYMLYLDALMDPHLLSQISIDLINSPNVVRYFSKSPSRRWLSTQLDHQTEKRGMNATKWLIGSVKVSQQQGSESEWADFTIQLRVYNYGPLETSMILNYIKFEPYSGNELNTEWVLASKDDRPSHAMAEVYKRASERKRRWSQRLHSVMQSA